MSRMKKKQKSLATSKSSVMLDKRLDEVNTDGWFQAKVDKANQILKTTGLPKGLVIR